MVGEKALVKPHTGKISHVQKNSGIPIKSAFLEDEDEKDNQEPALGSSEQNGFLQSRRDIPDVESMIEDVTEESESDSENTRDDKTASSQG